jgi:hypothetical protein
MQSKRNAIRLFLAVCCTIGAFPQLAFAQANLLQNGDFSAGLTGWTPTVVAAGVIPGFPQFNISTAGTCVPAQAGNPYFALNVPGQADGYIQQQVALPASPAASLRFVTWGNVDVTTATISIVTPDAQVHILQVFAPPPVQSDLFGDVFCSGLTPTTKSYDLSAFAGQMVNVRIEATSGGSNAAIANFDNVVVSTDPCDSPAPPAATSLVASVLPSSRSVQVGAPATAFATILNSGSTRACRVGIALAAAPGATPPTFSYRATDCATNAVTGGANAPVNIAAGSAACFVISITPTAPFAPTEVPFTFAGSNAPAVPVLTGINTLLMSASNSPVPDLVALGATLSNDGIVHLPGPARNGVFSVATVDVGAPDTITVSANTGANPVPVTVSICETSPGSGACLTPAQPSVTLPVATGATPTFGVFVTANGAIPLDPAHSRIFVVFADSSGVIRGRTSVAVETQ